MERRHGVAAWSGGMERRHGVAAGKGDRERRQGGETGRHGSNGLGLARL